MKKQRPKRKVACRKDGAASYAVHSKDGRIVANPEKGAHGLNEARRQRALKAAAKGSPAVVAMVERMNFSYTVTAADRAVAEKLRERAKAFHGRPSA